MKKFVTSVLLTFTAITLMAQDCGLTSFTLNNPTPAQISATDVFLSHTSSGTGATYIYHYKLVNAPAYSVYTPGTTILTPGAQYIFYVHAHKTCILFGDQFVDDQDSNTITVLMEPPTPTGLNVSFASITTNSFTASWNAVQGAETYYLDVSSNPDFISYHGYVVNGGATSFLVNSFVNSGSIHYLRLKASNSSGDSGYVSSTVITLPTAPTSVTVLNSAPNDIKTDQFAVTWGGVTGATGYRLDVSTSAGFEANTFVAGYNNLLVPGLSGTVNGLSSGINYFVRVRAEINSVPVLTSSNSNPVVQTITLPAAPTLTAASGISTSGFTANWASTSGANDYRFDVSTNSSFASILPAYNNRSVNSNSQLVTGLIAGVTYYYRVRAVNASGTSTSSSTGSIITISPAPVATGSTEVSTTTFTAAWGTANGASGYLLDVATTADFTDILPGYNSTHVNATSFLANGLLPGTNYFYRVRAINASGNSANSNSILVKTISSAPTAGQPTNISATSFTANWDVVTGAENYQLDVSANESFNSMLLGYDGLIVGSGLGQIQNLTPGTTYYYRVRALNSAGPSANSGKISALTLPDLPRNFKITNPQPASLTAEWSLTQSADEYDLEVSTSEDFTSIIDNYNPKVISGFSSQVIEGLLSSTHYYFRIKSKNSSGFSENYALAQAITANVDGTKASPPIRVNNLQFPITRTQSLAQEVSINADGGFGELNVSFYHRKKSETTFTRELITSLSTSYDVPVSNEWLDDLGMEFYFEIADQTNEITREPQASGSTHTILRAIPSFTIPLAGFGTELKNYQMISFPYSLAKTKIEDVLVPVLGEYKKTSWRFQRYLAGGNEDYQDDGLRVSDITQGEAYWLISKNPVVLTFSDAVTYDNSVARPFRLSLKKGWNQIGNPFPYDISWQDVLAANANALIDQHLLTFSREAVSFSNADSLKIFGGGFVLANEDTELIFPVSPKQKGGRVGIRDNDGRIDESLQSNAAGSFLNWFLPITLSQGEVVNTLSGVGMHVNAQDSKDLYDLVTPPRFVRYVELNSRLPDYEYELSQNIVHPDDQYKWTFTVESNSSLSVELKWDKAAAAVNGQFILYDQTQQILIDMSKLDSYSTIPGATITINYNRTHTASIEKVELGVAYPNPFKGEFTIPFGLSSDASASAELTVYDLMGRVIAQRNTQGVSNSSGLQVVRWDGVPQQQDELRPGTYIYRLIVTRENETSGFHGKIIKE